MKLISMTEYVLEQGKLDRYQLTDDECFQKIFGYAHFLKQPLTLGMFVPCDLEGVVLKEPSCYDDWLNGDYPEMNLMAKCNLYEKATESVLFNFNIEGLDGIEYNISRGRTIEYLTAFDSITLTPNAIKNLEL